MIKINDVEILTVLDGMVWSGAKDNAIRTLDFEFLYNPLKPDIPKYKAACGYKVEYIENGKTLFLGQIEKVEYTAGEDTINIHCVDLMCRLKRSKFVGRYKGTLNEIVGKICGLFGYANGINVKETAVLNIVSTGDKTYYDVLFEACSKMYKYFQLYMDSTTLKLAEHESQGTFKIGQNIRSSSSTQDTSEMVNKVLIIDDKGNIIDTIKDNSLMKFGTFQEVYNYNKKTKNNIKEAEKLIKDVENKSIIVCDNDNNCISGRYIKVLEPVSKFMGFFEIQTDTHTISADSVMTLEIKFIKKTEDNEGIEEIED